MSALVTCRGLVKRYRDVLAVDGLDLDINAGECLGLLGPNGAGKTTTVEMIEGLTSPDGGTVELFGWPWRGAHEAAIRQRIGVQLQETRLSDILTVEETLRMFRSFYAQGRRVDDVIAALSLGDKRNARVGKLSGGQRQRVALGAALVGAPDLIFLDEPTTGLDPQARRNVWDIIQAFRQTGGTVCLTTHYMEEAARLCSRIAIIDQGKIIAMGSPDELIASLGATELVEIETEPAVDASLFSDIPGVTKVEAQELGYSLHSTNAASLLPVLLQKLSASEVSLKSVTTRTATLEDVFIHLTGRGLRDA